MVRPKAAQRRHFQALKIKLGKLHSGQWQKAQCIMNEMVALCGVSYGPGRGLICPRACSFCDHFGHNRKSCPVIKVARARALDSDIKQMNFEKSLIPQSREEARDDAHWQWILKMRDLDARFKVAVEAGLGCKSGRVITCASDIDLDCQCAGCIEWRVKF